MSGPRAVLTGVLVGLLVAAGALLPRMADADGDPASDVLVSQSLFMPYDAGVSSARQAQLEALLRSAQQAGLPVRVAMIPSEYDLGSVGVLWHDPRTYARFLGIELSLTYTQRLLVVMPNGFGLNWPHHATTAAYKVLGGVPIGAGGAGLVDATETAIQRLAAAEGVTLSSKSSSLSRAASSSFPLIAGVLLALALLAGVGALLVLRRGRASTPAQSEDRIVVPKPARAPRSLARLRWGIGGLTALCIVLGAMLLVLSGPRRGSAAGSSGSSSGEHQVVWADGQRTAPDFQLINQNGQAISPANYRGRPLIVTFIDPLCRNLCPLAGKILSDAVQRLPATQRPQIIAVSVDIYADTRADLQADYRHWSLVPQWHWAVGSPSQLASVWKRYYAEVEVETKHIAGTTVHYITHSEMAYLIDGRGSERELFSWPYTPQQIDTAVRQLS